LNTREKLKDYGKTNSTSTAYRENKNGKKNISRKSKRPSKEKSSKERKKDSLQSTLEFSTNSTRKQPVCTDLVSTNEFIFANSKF
jgi:hypothetical protein